MLSSDPYFRTPLHLSVLPFSFFTELVEDETLPAQGSLSLFPCSVLLLFSLSLFNNRVTDFIFPLST